MKLYSNYLTENSISKGTKKQKVEFLISVLFHKPETPPFSNTNSIKTDNNYVKRLDINLTRRQVAQFCLVHNNSCSCHTRTR